MPYGEDWLFDLVALRRGRLERVQVKHGVSDGEILEVRARTLTVTGGRAKATHKYTAVDIDWLAVWDAATDRCAYIPAAALGSGMSTITLRLAPAKNQQRRGIHRLQDYLEF